MRINFQCTDTDIDSRNLFFFYFKESLWLQQIVNRGYEIRMQILSCQIAGKSSKITDRGRSFFLVRGEKRCVSKFSRSENI